MVDKRLPGLQETPPSKEAVLEVLPKEEINRPLAEKEEKIAPVASTTVKQRASALQQKPDIVRDIETALELTLEEAFRGTAEKISFTIPNCLLNSSLSTIYFPKVYPNLNSSSCILMNVNKFSRLRFRVFIAFSMRVKYWSLVLGIVVFFTITTIA